MNTRTLLCACAAAAAMMTSTLANTAITTRTNVPFAFVASDTVVSVRHETGDTALAVVTRHVGPVNGAAQPKLILVNKNGQYHLSEIHLANAPFGEQIPVK